MKMPTVAAEEVESMVVIRMLDAKNSAVVLAVMGRQPHAEEYIESVAEVLPAPKEVLVPVSTEFAL